MATDLNPIAYYPLGEQAQNSGYRVFNSRNYKWMAISKWRIARLCNGF